LIDEVLGDCCTATPGVSSCIDAATASCVCDVDPFCCDVEWDGRCADFAGDLGCAVCP